MGARVGSLRQQTALCDSDTLILIVSHDDSLKNLQIVRAYPDTIDDEGYWGAFFKIEVRRKVEKEL